VRAPIELPITDAEFTVIRGPDPLAGYEKRIRWLFGMILIAKRAIESDEGRRRRRDVRWFLWGFIGLAMLGPALLSLIAFLRRLLLQ